MWPPSEHDSDEELGLNPYESFMKKHLQHYGYFTGRNQNYRNGFQQYNEWEKTYTYAEGSSSSSDSDSDSDDDKSANDNRLQEELLRTTQLIYSCESGRMVPRLREPRNLYALAKELGPQQAARWPSEIQVLDSPVHHLYHVPAEPEPFYRMTGTEKTPMVRGEENGGKLVFEYDPKFSFFMRSRVGGSRNGCSKCCVDLESEEDTTLLFESRFESGNLAKAVKVGDYDYELWLRYDLYTNKHTQWFYFRIMNVRPNTQYRFTIVNFLKPDSLYNYGMRLCMYSEKEAQLHKIGWIRAGQDIKYYRNNLRYETSKGDRCFYSLTFTMTFPHKDDTVYLAHCYPYTYSDLQDYLLDVQNDPIKSRICKQRILCRTLAGNLVYVLTITSASQNPDDMKHKKAVVITARVHPGESNSSWMMKGFLDYLTGNSADAKLLRDTFIFKIVPMLNPDGVIVGNYRCSLAGRDLNRNYKTVLKDSYPSVWHTKNMIRKLLQERDIIIYCDLHGHSRRQNVFIYGCEQRLNTSKRLHERVFPCMLNKNAPDKFSYDSCKFKVQKSKDGTGRVVMWNMGIMNSYTMEATFCGSSLGKKKGFHFSMADYESLGYHFCDTLLDYCDPDNTKYANILGNLENRLKMEILARFGRDTTDPSDINLSDYASEMESSDGGSDSSVSDGPPLHLQYSLERPLKKKKKLKMRKDRDRGRQTRSEEPQKPTEDKMAGKAAGDNSLPSKQDKVGAQPLRYSTVSGKRPRSNDDRSNSGIPIFVQERFEERQQKRQDYLEALTSAYLRNGIPVNKDQGAPASDGPGTGTTLDEFVRSQITPSQSISPLDRRPPSRPHLLEVSAAQQRQQDTFRDSGRPVRTHPNPFDEKTGKGQYPRTQVPSATAVNYKATTSPAVTSQPISLLGQGASQSGLAGGDGPGHQNKSYPATNGHRDHDRSGRKSRRGMREGEDEDGDYAPTPRMASSSILLDLGQKLSTRPPRVKSANTSQEMIEAVDSIRQLQQSLHNRPHSTLTVATGTYIKQLIKETNDEIQDLTNEIEDEIEHKLQEVRELQHHHPQANTNNHNHNFERATSAKRQGQGNGAGTYDSGSSGATIDFQPQVNTRGTSMDRPQTAKSWRSIGAASQLEGTSQGLEAMDRMYHLGDGRKREGSANSTFGGREEYVRVASGDGVGERLSLPKYP